MNLVPFPTNYAREKYPGDTFSGRVLDKDSLEGWYGNSFQRAMERNGIVAFVSDGKTIGACADMDKIDILDIKDLRAIYKSKTGEDAAKTWVRDTIIEKLTGKPVV